MENENIHKKASTELDEIREALLLQHLDGNLLYDISIYRGMVITFVVQIEEQLEIAILQYFFKNISSEQSLNFRLCYFTANDGLKSKIENFMFLVQKTMPNFHKTIDAETKFFIDEGMVKLRNIAAHYFVHNIDQKDGKLHFFHTARSASNNKKEDSYILREQIPLFVRNCSIFIDIIEQYMNLLAFDKDLPVDYTRINEIRLRGKSS
jgi:hypothetical protein